MRERDDDRPATLFILRSLVALEGRQLVAIRRAFPRLATRRPRELRARIEGRDRVVLGRHWDPSRVEASRRALLEVDLPLELRTQAEYDASFVRKEFVGGTPVGPSTIVELVLMPAFHPEAMLRIEHPAAGRGAQVTSWHAAQGLSLRDWPLEDELHFEANEVEVAPVETLCSHLSLASTRRLLERVAGLDTREREADDEVGVDGISIGLGYRANDGTWVERSLWSPRPDRFPTTHRLLVELLSLGGELEFRPECRERWRRIGVYLRPEESHA